MKKLKELKTIQDIPEQELLTGGSPTCAGCGPEIGLKMALKALGKDTIVVNAAGCMTLLCNYPYTPLKVSWLFNAIENASATAAGIKKVLMKKKIDMNVLCYVGDGATYDIGLGSLSGAATRNDPIIYICYNNQTYGNTGDQASGATPYLTATKTTPPGRESRGNKLWNKNMTNIMAAHNVYSATASLAHPIDYMNKVRKAASLNEFAYIELLGTCPTNWHFDPGKTIAVSKLAVETGFWPLYEIYDNKFTLNYKPETLKPIKEFLKLQGRFRHLTESEIDEIQRAINKEWEYLKKGQHWEAEIY